MGNESDSEHLREENLLLKELLVKSVQKNLEEEKIGRVFHDFNNILSSSMGYSSLALERSKSFDDEKLTRYLGNIERAGVRARDLVRERLEERKERRDAESVHLTAVLSELCSVINNQVEGPNVEELFAFTSHDVLLYAMSLLGQLYEGDQQCQAIELSIHEGEECNACHSELRGMQVRVVVSINASLFPSAHDKVSFALAKVLINSYGGHLCESLVQDKQYVVYLRCR